MAMGREAEAAVAQRLAGDSEDALIWRWSGAIGNRAGPTSCCPSW